MPFVDLSTIQLDQEPVPDVFKGVNPNNPPNLPMQQAPKKGRFVDLNTIVLDPPEQDVTAQVNPISPLESTARGALYGTVQQPIDVIGAGIASLAEDIPFQDTLKEASKISLSGQQGEAKRQNPTAFGGGQLAGNIATTFLPSTGATNALGRLAPYLESIPFLAKRVSDIAKSKGIMGTLGSGAIQGGVSSSITDGDPLGGAVGGAAGSGIASTIGKIAQPIITSPAKKVYTDIIKKSGISDLTAGQMTGNRGLELLDSVFGQTIGTSGKSQKRSEEQLRKFTKAALEKAGIKSDNILPSTLARAEKGFEERYSSLIEGIPNIKIDSDVLSAISEVESRELKRLPVDQQNIVKSYINDIMSEYDIRKGLLPKNYQETRSSLSRRARSMSDPFAASSLRKIRDALDAAAERSLPSDKKGDWKKLNREYANYKTIQDAAARVSKDALEGRLSPGSLLQSSMRSNKSKSQKGYGDLYSLARAGRSSLSDMVPNSGTAQRTALQNLITGNVLGSLGVGGLTYGATQDPTLALSAAAAPFVLPKAIQGIVDSPAAKKYLTEGVPYLRKLNDPTYNALAALAGASLNE